MFRKMRRARQELPIEESRRILEQGTTAVLGLSGDAGYPYTVPVNYVYADGKIYLHGARAGHKYDAIARYSKVSLCVIEHDDVDAEALATNYRSVIVFGQARILTSDEEVYHAAMCLGLRYNPNEAAVAQEIRREWNALCCIEITVAHMTGKEATALAMARRNESE